MFDINNKNHRVNCIKICLNGHDGSVIQSLNFFNDTLISGSKNGLIVLWNLSNDSVNRLPHYVNQGISRVEVINPKTFLALTNDLKIYIFQKVKNQLLGNFECTIVIHLEQEARFDRIISSCMLKKVLWIGTEKSRIITVDLEKFFEENLLRMEDFFTDISRS